MPPPFGHDEPITRRSSVSYMSKKGTQAVDDPNSETGPESDRSIETTMR